MIGFIIALLIGAAAGYIAGRVMNSDHGAVMNVVLGVAGAFLFNIILFALGFGGGGNILGQLVAGVIGACLLIWGYRVYKTRS